MESALLAPNDSQFETNAPVTLQHVYNLPPVAKPLGRQRVKNGDHVGIQPERSIPPSRAKSTEKLVLLREFQK